MTIIAIIIWIVLFMILVLIHELWHFIAAKKSWVKVQEFWIWIPPKLFKIYTDKSWTEYTINLLPLWWFVRLKWEDPNNYEEFRAKDSFISINIWKKLIILAWWVFMNLVFAWILFTIAFWQGIKPLQVIPDNLLSIESQSYIMPSYNFIDKQWFISWSKIAVPVTVELVLPWSLATKIGILSWDNILKVDNTTVDSMTLSKTLKNYMWKSFELTIKRWENIFTWNWKCPDDSCLLGIVMTQWWDMELLDIKFSLWWAINAWFHEIWAQTELTLSILKTLWKNLISFNKDKIKSSVDKLSGPVWAIKIWEIILSEFGIWMFLAFGWMISLWLAIFNFLPIPALDGWRAVWVIIQSLFKLRPEKYFVIENYMNITMFVLLLWLWIYIILLDLVRFWWINIPWINW